VPKNFGRFLLTAGLIAAAIVLLELFKSKAVGAFWKRATEAA
jgi:hypothetical protein